MRRLSESAKTFEPTRVIDHLGYPASSRPWRPEPLHEENPRSRPHVTSLILHSFDSSQQLRCQPLSWAQLVGDLPHQQNVIHDILKIARFKRDNLGVSVEDPQLSLPWCRIRRRQHTTPG